MSGYDAFHYPIDDIFLRFGSQLFRQNVGILTGTYRASLDADLFWLWERPLFWCRFLTTADLAIEMYMYFTSQWLGLLSFLRRWVCCCWFVVYCCSIVSRGFVFDLFFLYDDRDYYNLKVLLFHFWWWCTLLPFLWCIYLQLLRHARVWFLVIDFNNRNHFSMLGY